MQYFAFFKKNSVVAGQHFKFTERIEVMKGQILEKS